MFDDGSPIYRQIAEQIKSDVLAGTLAADSQVMSTNEYAAYYRINPATAARAFTQLVDEGVLYKRRGIGMFVSPDARERLLRTHRERFMAEVVDPMVVEAAVIGISITEVIDRIHELDRAAGGTGDRTASSATVPPPGGVGSPTDAAPPPTEDDRGRRHPPREEGP